MSTTPSSVFTVSTPAASGFDWKSLLGVVELAANTATTVLIPGGAAFTPLLASLETAINPLLQSIGTKPSVSSEIMTVYGTIIGILTTLKNTPGLPSDTLAKIDEYIIAAQNGTAAYLQASQGYDVGLFAPVTPIV